MHRAVVDRVELVELKHFLVPLSSWLHIFTHGVVSNMVYFQSSRSFNQIVERLSKLSSLESWKEWTCVIYSLDERVHGVVVRLDGCHDHRSMLVLQLHRSKDRLCSFAHSSIVTGSCILDSEGDVLDAIAVLGDVRAELLVPWIQSTRESQNDVIQPYHVSANIPMPSFKTLVSNKIKAESTCIVGGCLFGVANPKFNVVK